MKTLPHLPSPDNRQPPPRPPCARRWDCRPSSFPSRPSSAWRERSAPTVKQHLACLRTLFDWLVTGQILPINPAYALWGPRHSVSKGSTPVISSVEARELLDSMNDKTVVGLRDRALVAVMAFTFARISAIIGLKIEDYYPQNKRWWLRLREKNGKVNEMPCHHKLEAYLDAYIAAAGIEGDRKGPLFRAATGRTG